MNKLSLIILSIIVLSCSNDQDDLQQSAAPKLIVKLDVDPNQVRLGNTGQPVSVAAGNSAQSPQFNLISAHYLEFAPTGNTLLGDGSILYQAPETNAGGDMAIDFNQSILAAPGATFIEIPLNMVNPGSYEWVRLSLAYQNYTVDFNFNNQPFTGTLASFVGFNTYIQDVVVNNQTITLNQNKKQGYWAFETNSNITTGQAPEGATTVPNPLFNSSPIPQGSCVVTGAFASPLTITGNETQDITITLSLSVNNSFEWQDTNNNGFWDVDANEPLVDMGLRGLIPIVNE